MHAPSVKILTVLGTGFCSGLTGVRATIQVVAGSSGSSDGFNAQRSRQRSSSQSWYALDAARSRSIPRLVLVASIVAAVQVPPFSCNTRAVAKMYASRSNRASRCRRRESRSAMISVSMLVLMHPLQDLIPVGALSRVRVRVAEAGFEFPERPADPRFVLLRPPVARCEPRELRLRTDHVIVRPIMRSIRRRDVEALGQNAGSSAWHRGDGDRHGEVAWSLDDEPSGLGSFAPAAGVGPQRKAGTRRERQPDVLP